MMKQNASIPSIIYYWNSLSEETVGSLWKGTRFKETVQKIYRTPHKLDLKELTLLDSWAGADPKLVTRPSDMLILDDCQGADMSTICT